MARRPLQALDRRRTPLWAVLCFVTMISLAVVGIASIAWAIRHGVSADGTALIVGSCESSLASVLGIVLLAFGRTAPSRSSKGKK
jgi:hypothetical protein